MSIVGENELDCQELERLSALTTRESVRDLLAQQIQVLREKITCQEEPKKEDEKVEQKGDSGDEGGAVASSDVPLSSASATPDTLPKPTESQRIKVSKLPTKTIKSYGWDQSPKFVKVYVTLNGVQSLPKEDITVEYTSSSMSLRVRKSDCIHQLVMNSLLQQIIPDKSHHKVKSDSIVLLLKKSEEKNWEYLTQTEKKSKQKGKPAAPKTNTADPSSGIMDLMKQMYDDGDDDMKRTIAQAWTQAREKKDTVDFP